MNLSKMLLATGLAAVLIGIAPPAFAQHHGGGGRSRGASGSRSGAVSRGESRAVSPRPAIGPRGAVSGGAAIGPRVYSGVRGGSFVRSGVAVPRYSIVAPVHFYRPYYIFRPRLSLGFGLWAGYPFAYSSAYYDPFYYPYGYVTPYGYPPYGYPATSYPVYPPASAYPPPSNYPSSAYPPDQQGPQSSIGVQPDQANTGGLSFEITPNTAQLFVDGALVGTVGQFTPTTQPLGLVAGHHRIEVRAPGYQTMSVEVDIIVGQVIPYQGALER